MFCCVLLYRIALSCFVVYYIMLLQYHYGALLGKISVMMHNVTVGNRFYDFHIQLFNYFRERQWNFNCLVILICFDIHQQPIFDCITIYSIKE